MNIENFINMSKRLKCECGNKCNFPYEKGNIINPKKCLFIGKIGEETFTINDGHTVINCPPFENFKEITIKYSKCKKIIFSIKQV